VNATPHHTQTPGAARPRVLHIVDMPGAGWDALAAAARCAAVESAQQRMLLIGDHAAAADAAAFGLQPDYRLCPPLNRLPAAVGPLDRLMKAVRRSWPVDLIHVWSDSARVLCRETLGYALPITQEDPAPFAPALRPLDRSAARAAMGVAPHETAVLLASDRPGVGDARRFAGMVGVLALAEYAVVGVAPRSSDSFRRAARFLRGFNRAWDIVPLATPPHLAVSGADIIVYDQGDSLVSDAGPGPRSGGVVHAAGALGMPVITTDSPLARRLLLPLAAELIARNGTMPEIARLTAPLCSDPARRAAVGEKLRTLLAHTERPRMDKRWLAALTQGAAA